ncbi:MAG: TonB-dependent receptor [Myxococcota bacterium]
MTQARWLTIPDRGPLRSDALAAIVDAQGRDPRMAWEAVEEPRHLVELALVSGQAVDRILGAIAVAANESWANWSEGATDTRPPQVVAALQSWLGGRAGFEEIWSTWELADTLRTEVRQRISDRYKVTYGVDLLMLPFQITFTGPPQQQQEGAGNFDSLASAEISTTELTEIAGRPGAYIENEFRPTSDVQLIAGLRFDYDDRTQDYAFDPRLVANWDTTESLRLKAGVGLYSQPPEFNESAAEVGNPDLDMIHSVHVGAGFEYEILEGFRVGVDGFYKYLWDRVVSTESGVDPFFDNAGVGRIYGAEISGKLEQRPGRPFFAYLSYTISRSERRDRPGDEFRLFDFDQTHIFTLSGVYNLPKNWSLGATMRLVSGNPSTPVLRGVYDAFNNVYQPVDGRINSVRNPNFHRLDIRVEKKWVFDSWRLALFLDIQNVYNRLNQEGLAFNYDYDPAQTTSVSGLPIIPALGIRGEI